jgi:hypothetical protein
MEVEVAMPSLYFPFTLRLYGHAIYCLSDHDFTGLDLFYRIKDCWKQRDTPHDLLLRPLEYGLASKIGEWCFNTLFSEGTSESMPTPHFSQLKSEQLFWFVEDVIEAAKCSQLLIETKPLEDISGHISRIDDLYGVDEEAYWRGIEGAGRRELLKMFSMFCKESGTLLSEMRGLYAPEVADRILHDRQLCNFLAGTVMNIGFDGETVEGLRAQWVERERWPEGVKAVLRARDRGRCATCGVDIVQELRETGQIDHIFPIARGGCNDVVNLQLLCAKCNREKRDLAAEASSSVPQYIRRVAKRPSA